MAKKQTSKKGTKKKTAKRKSYIAGTSGKLTEKQKVFADEYLKTGNVMQSALTAGYSQTFAKASSYKLLDYTGIKAYTAERLAEIEKLQAEEDAKRLVSVKEGLEFLSAVVRGEVTDQLGLETPVAVRSKTALDLIKRQGGLKDAYEIEMHELTKEKMKLDMEKQRLEMERQRLEMQLAKERLELEKQRLELDREKAKLFEDDDEEETGILALPTVDVETYEREKAEELARLTAELGDTQ